MLGRSLAQRGFRSGPACYQIYLQPFRRPSPAYASTKCSSRSPLSTVSATNLRRIPPVCQGLRFPTLKPKSSCTARPRLSRGYHEHRNRYYPTPERLKSAKPLNWKRTVIIAAGSALFFAWYNIETVPVSGRKRFNCFSEESIETMQEMNFKKVMMQLHQQGARFLPDWDPRAQQVHRVMRKLIPFSGLADKKWEIYVIDAPGEFNAFVLPGGKVFVFSGILRLARNDSQVATVLGHEIAHNLANHVGEQMSANLGLNILAVSLVGITYYILPFLLGFSGIQATVDLLFGRPMNRTQESEADYIGLMMMAEACYDPREAVTFWERMNAASQGEPPEWLSTHPAHATRIENIREWIPKAMEKRAESDCTQNSAQFADLFRKALEHGYIIIT